MRLVEQLTGITQPRLADLAARELDCPCGRRHTVPIEALATHGGSVQEVGPFLAQRGAQRVWLIADERTFAAAGPQVEASCREAGVAVKKTILPGEPMPHADRDALGRLAFDLEPVEAPLVAVGSGTVSDLTRFLAYRTGTFFVTVPTAPSMDGYTSSVAAMLVDGVRITYPAAPPRAIFADPQIYSHAPRELIGAGYAEMLGKLTALADWRLAATLNGEYHCPLAEELVTDAVRPILADPGSPAVLMEGLLWVGLAMLLVGNSRPASGSEHHLAHYWEMRALWEGREPYGHGVRVGVASVLIQRIYRELFDRHQDRLPELAAHAQGAAHGTEAQIRAWYGPVADGLLKEQASWGTKAYGPRPLTAEELRAAAQAVQPYRLDPDAAQEFLARAGAPQRPQEIDVSPELVQTTLQAAKEVRNRFTILHLASELGLLEEMSRAVAREIGDGHRSMEG